ncbi:MAG: hypothetical protein H6558_02310 [Lewinellaceae bacterium]|nr:hypothetical protein [Lewinellaceae bacterium]MCB9288238.1 hypothetical protein [Lewinellaceae bacterium]
MRTFKIIAAVFSLVGIGFIAGFFTHRYVALQQIHKVAEMRLPPGFEEHLYHIIGADSEQQKQLHPIVHSYAGRISEVHTDFRARRKALIDSMHQEIKPLLTEEQVQKLDDFSRHFRERTKKRRPPEEKNHQHDGLREKRNSD